MTVYDILSAEGMADYYCYDESPGVKMDKISADAKFKYLDHEEIVNDLLDFRSEKMSKVKLFVPQIHCSSCIWLLENLHKLDSSIAGSEVNFAKKEVLINFSEQGISLKNLVILLATVGYEPSISLASKKDKAQKDKSIYYKIGIAGFCFGNIMLMSFPEYFGIESSGFEQHQKLFLYLIFAFSLPVVLYCASDYFTSAINGIASKHINIDVPISLGIFVLFLRSTYEIFSHTGPGYFDSLSGLVFFLIIGKWYQNKLYESLTFDRDYKSYFPIAVNKIINGKEVTTQLKDLIKGDEIVIRNHELVPADAKLLSNAAHLDYSFVTGESDLILKQQDDHLYAGGRQVGETIHVVLQKSVNQSYLTSLWNQDTFSKKESKYKTIIDVVSKYFTLAILIIAAAASVVWYVIDPTQIFNVVSAILIIACPCALALTVPFTLGNAIRVLGKKGFYAKNINTLEKLSKVDHVVLDKTGTITSTEKSKISFVGKTLNKEEQELVKSLCKHSAHPLSKSICQSLDQNEVIAVAQFKEELGKGISGVVKNQKIQLGNAEFLDVVMQAAPNNKLQSRVHLKIQNEYKGYYSIDSKFRPGFNNLMTELEKRHELHVISGDDEKDFSSLKDYFKPENVLFKQSPTQKLNYIKSLQNNESVLMVGDGLNDAGALKQSDVGIAISDNVHAFSPACDGILSSEKFELLSSIISYSKSCMTTVKIGFILSFMYNVVGISLALANQISPLTSAILMPLSSVTVVLFSNVTSNILAKKHLN